ncbi:MAG: hypothetical protein ACFCU3_08350 [Verrucomicrobiales bacterium]
MEEAARRVNGKAWARGWTGHIGASPPSSRPSTHRLSTLQLAQTALRPPGI